jgi:tRNA U54 and U55 pseudouridine synthase Pus10
MNDTMTPSENYEALKIQFKALVRLLKSKEAQINYYEKKISELSPGRVLKLEAELESQKEMNAILTEELQGK